MVEIDLHIHSKYSLDGEFSPTELLRLCEKNRLDYMAITDHNTVQGIEEAILASKNSYTQVIPGIELDCSFAETNLQLLGYYFDYRDPIFVEIEAAILAQEQQATEKKLELLKQLDVYVDEEKLRAKAINGVISGEMIADVLLSSKENQDNPLLAPYRPGGSRSFNPLVSFHWDFCTKGKPLYTPINYISLTEAVNIIKRSGGVTILAHPGNNVAENQALLDQIMDCGVDGLEVYSSYHTDRQKSFYKSYAIKRGCLLTYGSDFHGRAKPDISIGCVVSDVCKKRMISALQLLNHL